MPGARPSILSKINCWCVVAHVFLLIFPVFGFLPRSKKPASVGRRRASGIFSISLAVTSGHGSPPAWMSHDDGGDRDGGGSASDSNLKGLPLQRAKRSGE
jgi:hypothetical protein